jgi:hypothetical protein
MTLTLRLLAHTRAQVPSCPVRRQPPSSRQNPALRLIRSGLLVLVLYVPVAYVLGDQHFHAGDTKHKTTAEPQKHN